MKSKHLVEFPSFYKEKSFVTVCLTVQKKLFWKEYCPTRKAFAPEGNKFFPLRIDPLSESRKSHWPELTP